MASKSVYMLSFKLILGNSLNEDAFKEKIKDVIRLREENIIKSQELQIQTYRRIAEAIEKTVLISSIIMLFN